MRYNAFVKHFNPDVEEEVKLEINGHEIVGFMPFGISFEPEESMTYPVSINLVILDDLQIQLEKSLEKGFFRMGESFAYIIKGILNSDKQTIDAGLELSLAEEMADDEMWQYNNKNIQIKVDRINIDFFED